MYFHAFCQCFRLILDTTLQKPENMLQSYLSITENRIEKLLLVRFLLPLLFRQMVENYSFFLGHIAMPQPMLNIMS